MNNKYFPEELRTNHHGAGARSWVFARTEEGNVRAGHEESQQSVRLQGLPEGGAQSGTESQAGGSISTHSSREGRALVFLITFQRLPDF